MGFKTYQARATIKAQQLDEAITLPDDGGASGQQSYDKGDYIVIADGVIGYKKKAEFEAEWKPQRAERQPKATGKGKGNGNKKAATATTATASNN